MRRRRGFTLLEVLVVIGLIAVVSMPFFSSYLTTLRKARLDTSVGMILDTLRTARNFARASKNDASWGVRSNGNTSYEIVFDTGAAISSYGQEKLSDSLTFQSQFEIWFVKGAATNKSNATNTITVLSGSAQKQIQVLASGVIDSE